MHEYSNPIMFSIVSFVLRILSNRMWRAVSVVWKAVSESNIKVISDVYVKNKNC